MSEQSNIQQNPLGTQPIGRLIARFAIPCIISMVVNALYNIVDQIFIGQGVGYLGNAATNVVFPLVTLSLAISVLVGDGCAANHSLKLGAGQREAAERDFGTAFTLMLIFGVVFFVVGSIFLTPLLSLFGATPDVMPFAQDYGQIIVIGLPFMIMTTGLNSAIRADGSPKYAMGSMLVGAVLNTILDPIFIFTFGMGVKGAAIATVIGQVISFFFSLLYLRRMKSISFVPKFMKPNARSCKAVLSLGVSSFITQVAIFFVQIVMNNTLKHYGAMSEFGSDIPLACLGIVMKVNMILISVIIGMAVGAQPIIGFNYGAKNYKRVKKTYGIAVLIASIFSLAAFLVFQFAPQSIINLFGNESELYNRFATSCFRIFLGVCFVNGFQITTAIFFQAIGKPVKAALLSLSRQVLFLIPLMLILPVFWGVEGTLFSGPIADMMAAIFAAILIVHELRIMNRAQHALQQEN